MNNIVKISISVLVMGASLTASATDYYLTKAGWGASGTTDSWTPNRTEGSESDNIYIDFVKRMEVQTSIGSTQASWNIGYALWDDDNGNVAKFGIVNSLTFQNLYNSKDPKSGFKVTVSPTATAANTTPVSFEAKSDVNLVLDQYNAIVTWKGVNTEANKNYTGRTMTNFTVGNAINIGSATSDSTATGTLYLGFSDGNIKNVSTKDINSYASGKLYIYADTTKATGTISMNGSSKNYIYGTTLNVNAISGKGAGYLETKVTTTTFSGDINLEGTSKILARGSKLTAKNITLTGEATLSLGITESNEKASALTRNVYIDVLTMNSADNKSPSVFLNNEATNSDNSVVVDIKGISGTGSIGTYVKDTGNLTYMILATAAGKEYSYSGTLNGIKILMTGGNNKGTQYLRGSNTGIGTISARSGTLYVNGKSLTSTNVYFENNGGYLGIVSEDTNFGELNVNAIGLNEKAKLLFDISGTEQDIITAKRITITSAFNIDFTLTDDVELNKEYKIFTADTLEDENEFYKQTVATNNLGYNMNFVSDGNSLSVIFSVAVPEPAEWAMIFGGLALGLAIYRRRK